MRFLYAHPSQKLGKVGSVLIAVILTLVVGCASPSTTPHTEQTHFCIDGETVVGGDGEPIELINNPDATNPTYAEVVAFLENDPTDTYPYIPGPPKNAFIDSDFAETVHNNAEAAGIRAAWVRVDLEDGTSHVLNAFETTDRGLIFTDSTGPEIGHQGRGDYRVYVETGQPYCEVGIGTPLTRFQFSIRVGWVNDPHDGFFPRLQEETWQTLIEKGWAGNFSLNANLDESDYFEFLGQMREMQAQRYQQMLEWLKKYDVEELGTEWMNEWLQQHEGELCGEDFKPSSYGGGSTRFDNEGDYTTSKCWRVDNETIYPPGEPATVEEKVIMIGDVPVVWQISRLSSCSATRGTVKAVHMQW